ncbi:MAG: phage portal protein [Anaerovoracaceae bacterium]
MFNNNYMKYIKRNLKENDISDKAVVRNELETFLNSPERAMMITGCEYFKGKQEILNKTRTAIGEGGNVVNVKNLPNSRLIDNQYKKMVKQKYNYILGNPITYDCEDEGLKAELGELFNDEFMKKLKNVAKDALNCGIGWLYMYYNPDGDISFKRFAPYEIKPLWKDDEHTELDGVIRVYSVDAVESKTTKTMIEYYTSNGIETFEYSSGKLVDAVEGKTSHYVKDDIGYNFTKVPFIPFKYNDDEVPLINSVKSLQDGLNKITSNFSDNMLEDMRNTIMVLVNYDGENLGEFRQNLSTYGAVKVRTEDGAPGDVKTLDVKVDSSNYESIIKIFKRAIIENAMGFDAKSESLGNAPNQMNIKSMYSDIDLDANDMINEFKASLETLVEFYKIHLGIVGKPNPDCSIKFTFNKNIMLNESELIANCRNSVGIISDETIIAKHPFVTDLDEEMGAIEKAKKDLSDYNDIGGVDDGGKK